MSVRAGIEYFYKDSQKDNKNISKILILGEMKELGEHSRFYHEDIGNFLNNYRFEEIFLIGNETRYILSKLDFVISVRWFSELEELIEVVIKLLKKDDSKSFYIKGSRGNRLDEIIKKIEEL